MAVTLILFILGLALIIKGAGFLVEGATCIARRLRVSNIVIALTVVSVGTTLPELVVNVFASSKGNTDLVIGNVIGSVIANILLVIGVAAVIYPLSVPKGIIWREIPMNLLAVIVLGVLANDVILNGLGVNLISRSDGMVMIAFLIIFIYYIHGVAKRNRRRKLVEIPAVVHELPKALLMVLVGACCLALGGNWVVDGAMAFAISLGVDATFIGLSIVAIGTSLPELATASIAAYKRNLEIAVGNAVGSSIFNVFWILALSAIIRPLPFNPQINFDISVAMSATLLLFAWMFIGKKRHIERWQGALFVCMYILYIALIAVRG